MLWHQIASTYIILFLTWHNESINNDKNDDLYTSSPCLTCSVFVPLMTSKSIADDVTMVRQCDAITWKVISNSLDINFIYGDIHGRSCKKHEYDIVISVRCVKSSIVCVYILYVGMRCVFFHFSCCVCIWNAVPISIWIKITTWPGNAVLVRLLISGQLTKHYMMQRAGWVLSTKSRDHNNTAYQEWHINDIYLVLSSVSKYM